MQSQFVTSNCLFLLLTLFLVGTGKPTLAQQQGLIPLKVAMAEIDPTKFVPLIAYEEGIFKKNGLAVDLFITPGAWDLQLRRDLAVPRDHVRDDTAPITHGGGSPGVVAASLNASVNPDRIIIATLDPMLHWWIVARPEIRRPEDVKGKRIGITGFTNMTGITALVACKQMGWDPKFDVSILEGSGDLVTLKKGLVDAIVVQELQYYTALAAGLGFHMVIDTTESKFPVAGSGITTTRTWLRENRDTARRYMKSIVEAIAVLKKDRSAANRAMAKWFNITHPEFQKMMYDGTFDMERKPYPHVEGIKATMTMFDSHEMRRHKAEDFYDDSLVRELDENGFIDSLYK